MFKRIPDHLTASGQRIDSQYLFSVRQIPLILNQWIFNVGVSERGSQLVLLDFLLKRESHTIATDEIAAKSALASVKAEPDPEGNNQPGGYESRLGELHEVQIRRANDV